MLKEIVKKLIAIFSILILITTYIPNIISVSFASDTDIISIIKSMPKYYVLDMEKFQDREIDVFEYAAQQLEVYLKHLVNDDSVEIEVSNLEGGGDFTFMEFSADISILKNGSLYNTVHFGWENESQITIFALITVPTNNETEYINYAKKEIENKYKWTYPYNIEKYEKLKNEDIVLLNTKKFGTVKFKGKDIESNIYAFIPQDDLLIPEPLLIMTDDSNTDIDTDIINIINTIPKYYVLDMKKFQDSENDIFEYSAQQLETYLKHLVNDDTIEIEVSNLEGGGDFTFIEFSADVNILKNGNVCDTVHFGWENESQITIFALITVPTNNEAEYIDYAKKEIEDKYKWTNPYNIEKYDQLKDKNIVLLNTEKFGTVEFKGKDIESNIYAFIPQDDLLIPEPLMIMMNLDKSEIEQGNGTETNPYLISTPEQLYNIRNDLSAVYKLVNDIDLTYDTSNEDGRFYNSGKGWSSIGTFSGKLDGNNKKIIGMTQKFEKTDNNIYEPGRLGLFSEIEGTVENLKLEEINLSYSNNTVNQNDSVISYVGGLTGILNGTIKNVQVDGKIKIEKNSNKFATNYIAGIIGYMENGIISDSTSNVNITSTGYNIAGIVGDLENGKLNNNKNLGNLDGVNCSASGIVSTSYSRNADIIKCSNYGTISSYSVAGIISNAAGVNIVECSNYGNIIIKDTSLNSYQSFSGGIVGFLYSSNYFDEEGNDHQIYSKVEKCFNIGNIDVEISISGRNGVDVGGIVGATSQNNNISNCFNAGRINVKNYYNTLVGGLVGRHQSKITNCYNVGKLTTTGDNSKYRICELIGAIVRMDTDDTAGKVENCYCMNSEINALSNDGGSKEIEYFILSTDELKNKQSYENFDFENIWNFDINSTYNYPQLRNNYIDDSFKLKYKLNGTITTSTISENEGDDAKIRISKIEDPNIYIYESNIEINNPRYNCELENGTYIITISKKNHVTRDYCIEVNDKDLECNIEIHLLGDITGDGKVNNKDWDRLYKHINGTNILTDYDLLCADVNKDGKINNKDWNRLYAHINETNKLW